MGHPAYLVKPPWLAMSRNAGDSIPLLMRSLFVCWLGSES